MFQKLGMPITSMGTRKSSSMVWRIICHDFSGTTYYYRYAQSLRSISENDKANQLWKNLIKCQKRQ
jgi:hypothetical protein